MKKKSPTALPPTITIHADFPAYGGFSTGRWSGKVVMITAAIPGETVEARIEGEKRDYLTATTVKILLPSPARVEPKSAYFGRCGGCQLQHVSYKVQTSFKEEILKSCLKRIGGMEISLADTLAGGPWNYRRRGQFKVSHGKIGFFAGGSHDVVDIESCALMTEELNEHYTKARTLLGREVRGVRELHITCGDGGAIALIKARSDAETDLDGLAQALLSKGFSGVSVLFVDGRLQGYGSGFITFLQLR